MSTNNFPLLIPKYFKSFTDQDQKSAKFFFPIQEKCSYISLVCQLSFTAFLAEIR